LTPALSIILVLFNSADELGDCLEGIREEVMSGWAEAICVDNASPDQSAALVRTALPEARIISHAVNVGFARGVNAALPGCRGDYVLLLNPDTVVPAGGLRSLVEWMERRPRTGAASPNIVGSDGVSHAPARAWPSIWRCLLETSRAHKLLPREIRSRVLFGAYWTGNDEEDVGWTPGTAMIVRRSVLGVAGLLNPDLFMYGEDMEWCWRIRRAGYRVGVASGIRFVHRGSSSAMRSWGADERQQRIQLGTHVACTIRYGRRHAALLAYATAVSAAFEALAPRRTRGERLTALGVSRRWFALGRRGTGSFDD
jgi:hypothetical protein